MKVLTAAAVLKASAGKERREVSDGGATGLRLIIQTSGHKSWAMRFRRANGKQTKLTLGPLAMPGVEVAEEPVIGQPLSLASARRLAAQINHERATGADVHGERQKAQLELKARGAATFDVAALDFIEQHAKRKTRRWKETARILGYDPEDMEPIKNGLAARWSSTSIVDITADDLHRIVDEAREKGTPGLDTRIKGPSESRARKMFANLSKMFAWLSEKRRIRHNPLESLSRPKAPEARERVLSDEEIIKFWKAADKEAYPFGPLLKLLLLTGQRSSEISGMRRSEINGDMWTIPKMRTKNKRDHDLPLPKFIQDIIPEGKFDLVFTTTGTTPVSGWTRLKPRLKKAIGNIPHWQPHDLRRTCATGMAEIGVAPHIIEAVLNHISGAKAGVAGIYNRAKYLPEKRAALERWAKHIQRLVEGRGQTKVVKLR